MRRLGLTRGEMGALLALALLLAAGVCVVAVRRGRGDVLPGSSVDVVVGAVPVDTVAAAVAADSVPSGQVATRRRRSRRRTNDSVSRKAVAAPVYRDPLARDMERIDDGGGDR